MSGQSSQEQSSGNFLSRAFTSVRNFFSRIVTSTTETVRRIVHARPLHPNAATVLPVVDLPPLPPANLRPSSPDSFFERARCTNLTHRPGGAADEFYEAQIRKQITRKPLPRTFKPQLEVSESGLSLRWNPTPPQIANASHPALQLHPSLHPEPASPSRPTRPESLRAASDSTIATPPPLSDLLGRLTPELGQGPIEHNHQEAPGSSQADTASELYTYVGSTDSDSGHIELNPLARSQQALIDHASDSDNSFEQNSQIESQRVSIELADESAELVNGAPDVLHPDFSDLETYIGSSDFGSFRRRSLPESEQDEEERADTTDNDYLLSYENFFDLEEYVNAEDSTKEDPVDTHLNSRDRHEHTLAELDEQRTGDIYQGGSDDSDLESVYTTTIGDDWPGKDDGARRPLVIRTERRQRRTYRSPTVSGDLDDPPYEMSPCSSTTPFATSVPQPLALYEPRPQRITQLPPSEDRLEEMARTGASYRTLSLSGSDKLDDPSEFPHLQNLRDAFYRINAEDQEAYSLEASEWFHRMQTGSDFSSF